MHDRQLLSKDRTSTNVPDAETDPVRVTNHPYKEGKCQVIKVVSPPLAGEVDDPRDSRVSIPEYLSCVGPSHICSLAQCFELGDDDRILA